MIILKWIFMLASCGYFCFVAFLYLVQRQFVFHPQSAHPSPAAAGLPEAEEAVVDTADGARVIVWQVPPRGEKPVVIYCHGNAEIVASRAKRHRQLTADGIGLVALSYRGYMGSIGSPTEDGLLHDAEAAYRLTTSRFPSSPVVLWGHSLGSGVAVAIPGRAPVAQIILWAPFLSVPPVPPRVFSLFPVRGLLSQSVSASPRQCPLTARP